MNSSDHGKSVKPWYVIDDHRFEHDGLEIVLTNDFDSPNFAAYHAVHELCLPDHMVESREHYRRLFDLSRGNSGQTLRDRFGEFADVVAVAREPGAQEVVAAAAAVFFRWKDGRRTMSCTYVITTPGTRRRRYGVRIFNGLCREMERRIGIASGDDRSFDLITGDVADPFEPESSQPPKASFAGIDRVEGRVLWVESAGGRIFDFSYREPCKTPGCPRGTPFLFLLFRSSTGHSVDASVLRNHLERYLTISVLGGQDARRDPAAREQLEYFDMLTRSGTKVTSTSVSDWLRVRSAGRLA